ncbi:DNA mismatch repair endonuclease MutL [Candidatus Falkowbacteria bacterium]|nr:DNA mismatch repair endonuclease MutL [Candidatus Falkowbacteria bacterium]
MIKILPQELINQIAAGEVIERPASVVKELVENSIDAGATKISVEIINGGINEIKIIDNGCGMNREDVLLSVEQHATSKIASAEDLFNIKTMGFRGEALASIASVSQFSLLSRQQADISGTKLIIENGEPCVEDAGCPIGTSVVVRELFYNVPARKKYLKTVANEYNHIVDLFLNYALAHPKIDWTLAHNGREVYRFSAADNLLERAEAVLGKEISNQLLAIEYETLYVKIFGFIGKPQIARQNKKFQFLFVNSRPVNEFIISKTIKDAFGQMIPKDLHPIYLLNLSVDPAKIDVNVHPRKLEVRFSEPNLIYQAFYRGAADVIDKSELITKISFAPMALETMQPQRSTNGFERLNFSERKIDSPDIKISTGQRPVDFGLLNFPERKTEWPYKYLGQINKAYLIVSDEKGIKIIDQHAASERLQYEKFIAEWSAGKILSQQMLFPQSIELALSEANILRQQHDTFTKLGFEIDEFGANTFLIRQSPALLSKLEPSEIVQEILKIVSDEILNEKTSAEKFAEVADDILKMMSCKSAIKFGDELSDVEAMALIEQLFKINKFTCVHGRPSVVEFSFAELNKMFCR